MSVRSYLTLSEFCEATRLSEATVRRLLKRGKIPFKQPGGPGTKLLFQADALEQVASGSQASPAPHIVDPTPRIPGPLPRWQKQTRKGGC